MNDFLTKPNLEYLYDECNQIIINKTQKNLDNYASLGITNRLTGIMNKISTQNKSKNYNLQELNKTVIKIIVPGFINMMKKADINPTIKLNRLENRPKNIDHRTNNVNSQFDILNKSRQDEIKKLIPKNISFTEDNDVKYDDPNILFDKLEKNRENELVELNKHLVKKKKSEIVNNVKTSPKNINNTEQPNINSQQTNINLHQNNFDKHIEAMDKFQKSNNDHKEREELFQERLKNLQNIRNNVFKSQLDIDTLNPTNKALNVEPKDFLLKNKIENIKFKQSLDKDENDNNILKIRENGNNFTSNKVENIQKKTINTPNITNTTEVKVNNTLVINSIDRRWYGNWEKDVNGNVYLENSEFTNRYDFAIKFGVGNEILNQPSISKSFKNITSIEVIDVIMSSHDNGIYVGNIINNHQIEYNYDILISEYCKKNVIVKHTEATISTQNNSTNEDVKNTDNFNNVNSHDLMDEVDSVDSDMDDDILENDQATSEYNLDITTEIPNATNYLNICMSNYQYLLLKIKEFSGKVLTTNSKQLGCVSRLIVDKPICRCKLLNDDLSGFFIIKTFNF